MILIFCFVSVSGDTCKEHKNTDNYLLWTRLSDIIHNSAACPRFIDTISSQQHVVIFARFTCNLLK